MVPATPALSDTVLIATVGGEVYVKSDRTHRRFLKRLRANLDAALAREQLAADVRPLDRGRMLIETPDIAAVGEVVARTFGIHRVNEGVPVAARTLDELVDAVADRARERVAGRTFAVRVRRSGAHTWGSMDAARDIGTRLLGASRGVDLDNPEVEVHVIVIDDRAWVLEESRDGPGGLPLGTQEPVLSLLSGGFDSPVAAWMMMRRGCPVEFLHVRLECAQADHALAVAHELWRRWGAGTSPLAWVVDFTGVKEAIEERVPPRLRQVVLKQLMFSAADAIAASRDIPALVTGEAIGQVSSQTLHHLAEIDRMCDRTVLRPLAGYEKNEIVERAHAIGTGGLSARAHEVCDLAGSRVAIAAERRTLERAHGQLPTELVRDAVRGRTVIALDSWMPGGDLVAVVEKPLDDVPVVHADDADGITGPAVITGERAAHVASRLHQHGHEVWVLDEASLAWPDA
jgi:tRNA uracil 4-sulfurtransferase